jgi:SAM-dependent methyltransferase
MTTSQVADHELNRLSWNAATERHRTHRPELIDRYVRDRWNNLFPEDAELLLMDPPSRLSLRAGPEVASSQRLLTGQRVLHLQCNDGQDTVSVVRAFHPAHVVGVDISDTAITLAGELKTALETSEPDVFAGKLTFVRGDVFAFMEAEESRETFDVVYSSYGALCWISDITRWAKDVARVLAPGGRLVIIDFHPMATSVERRAHHDCVLVHSVIGGARQCEPGGVGDYVGDDFAGEFKNPHPSVEYTWGVGDIASGILHAGLELIAVREYQHINAWRCRPDLVPRDSSDDSCRQFVLPAGLPAFPLMFGFAARKRDARLT